MKRVSGIIRLLVAVAGLVVVSASGAQAKTAAEDTPLSLPGSEPVVYRTIGGTELRLHVVKPDGWSEKDRRTCLVAFFGGGWVTGTPKNSVGWAKWAARYGCVGVAADYRTRSRFGGDPEDCVADGRAAVRWVQEHADELGIDPSKIVVEGSSAGGHVAAWTAILLPGPGKDDPAPEIMPAALILINPVIDTKESGFGGPGRFDGSSERPLACSVIDQMPSVMPPAIVFHATGDQTVPYANSVAFRDKMAAAGNRCELVSFQGLGHSYFMRSKYGDGALEADRKTHAEAEAFLVSLDLIETHGPQQETLK